MTTDLTALEAKAAKAQAAYEAAAEAAAAVRQQKLNEENERARQLDEQFVNGYSDAAYDEAVRQAQDELERAIAESDIGKAWIALQMSQLRHAHDAVEFNTAHGRLGRQLDHPRAAPVGATYVEHITQVVEKVAAEQVYAELGERDAERAAYIAGPDEG